MEFVPKMLSYLCQNLFLRYSLCAERRGLDKLQSFRDEKSKGFVRRNSLEAVFVIK